MNGTEKELSLRSPFRMAVIIAVSVFAIELAIMFLIHLLPPIPEWIGHLIDASALTLLLSPVIYYFVFRPMASYITEVSSAKEVIESLVDEAQQKNKELSALMEKLTQSEEKYRKLVDTSPNGVFVHCEGRLVFINPAGARMLGAENPGQLIGRPVMDFVLPEYREAVNERLKKILEQGTTASEEKFLRPDGTVVDVEMSAGPMSYDNKPAVQGIAIDITERKKAEKELMERIDDLERFRKATVQREFRIKELKDENEELKRKLGLGK